MTLHRCDGAIYVGYCLTLGGFTDEHFAVFGERNHRRGGAEAFCVSDYGGLSTFQHANRAVGGAEVDAYCTCHMCFSLFVSPEGDLSI